MRGPIQVQFSLFGTVKRKNHWYIAHCPPLGLTTQGRTVSEARQNLLEASELFVISCLERRTLDQALRELGFVAVKRGTERLPENGFKMVIPIPMRFQSPCHD